MKFVTFDPADGKITGRYEVSDSSQLAHYANHLFVEDDSVPVELTHRVDVSSLVLARKPMVSLSVDSAQIAADGIAQARVSLSGLVSSATIVVNGQPVNVSPVDVELIITSTVIADFTVSLVNDPFHYGTNSVVVKAR